MQLSGPPRDCKLTSLIEGASPKCIIITVHRYITIHNADFIGHVKVLIYLNFLRFNNFRAPASYTHFVNKITKKTKKNFFSLNPPSPATRKLFFILLLSRYIVSRKFLVVLRPDVPTRIYTCTLAKNIPKCEKIYIFVKR